MATRQKKYKNIKTFEIHIHNIDVQPGEIIESNLDQEIKNAIREKYLEEVKE